MDVHAYMAERVPRIDACIEKRIPSDATLPDSLRAAMRHLLFPGGKRLRPVFAMAAAEAVGGAPDSAMPMCVAVELIHTYSLIHDDLPCMDDDDERRGRPTVHVAFDEATAVLAGDALLTEAFGVLGDGVGVLGDGVGVLGDGAGVLGDEARATEAASARLFAVSRLARAAGAAGLVGGQVDDLLFAAGEQDADSSPEGTDQARLASIHARKTAALFQAAVVGGAALGGATEAERGVLDEFAREVGVAFQIADDLLDSDSGEAASILRLQGERDARSGAEGLLDAALARIEGWGERAEPLRALACYAVRRNR